MNHRVKLKMTQHRNRPVLIVMPVAQVTLTEELVESILPKPETLQETASLAIVKAVLLDPSGENVAALNSLPSVATAPLLDRVLYAAHKLLHRSSWCDDACLDTEKLKIFSHACQTRKSAFKQLLRNCTI